MKKKEWQSAYNWILSSVEKLSDELKDMALDIAEINDDISDINSDAVEDVKDRYADITKELDTLTWKINELEAKTKSASIETSNMEDDRKAVTKQITDSQKQIDWYQKSISKINDDISSLDTTSSEQLAERYVELWSEIENSQTQLDELNAKATLSTEEAEKKLKLEEDIAKAKAEQSLAESQTTAADISDATIRSTESETERILREKDEKKAAYEQELIDLQDKLNAEQVILATAQVEEANLRGQLDKIEIQEQQAKLDKLQSQLEWYYDDRAKLLIEKRQAENILTNKQQQDALDEELTTKTAWIIAERNIDLEAKKQELVDLKESNKAKLDEMKAYFLQILRMSKMSKAQFWESFDLGDFSFDDLQGNLSSSNIGWFTEWFSGEYKDELKAQVDATEKIAKLWDLFEKLNETNKKDSDNMFRLLKIVTWLRETAALPQTIDQRMLKTINQNNNFSVTWWIDMASIESMLRRSLKI